MTDEVSPCPWELIEQFRDWREFWRFERWMQDQVLEGRAEETAVLYLFSGADLPEKWFRHTYSGEVWRLVKPDPPFAGLFERVVDVSNPSP